MIFFILLLHGLNGLNAWNTLHQNPIYLIGHRGEKSFSIPEHSIPGYHLAIWEHADFIEPDLVLTKDGILICFHDLALKKYTDVDEHAEFKDRMRNLTLLDLPGTGGQ